MSWRRTTTSAAGTQRAGEELASLLAPGDVVLLDGPLGAGKTTFTQGLARGLGVTERVTSPTFTLVRQHRCAAGPIRTLHHADLYRLDSVAEVLDLSLSELVEESAVAVVEWGERAHGVLGREVLEVRLIPLGEESRELVVSGELARGREERLEAWSRS